MKPFVALLALLVGGGCAATAPSVPVSHPANPQAPAGRLAGAPPSLRAGVVTYPDVPPLETEKRGHDHHDHH